MSTTRTKKHAYLDDTDTGSVTEEESVRDESFRTPEDGEVTDYGLEFSTSLRQSPRRCSTLRKGNPIQSKTATGEKDGNGNYEYTETTERRKGSFAKKSTSRVQCNIPSANIHTAENPSATVAIASKTTAAVTTFKQKPVKPRQRKQLQPTQKALKFQNEVLQLQATAEMLIPRLPFSRLVREIMQQTNREIVRITDSAFEALQTSAEMYLTQCFQDAYLLTLHRGRITLSINDMNLLNYIRTHN